MACFCTKKEKNVKKEVTLLEKGLTPSYNKLHSKTAARHGGSRIQMVRASLHTNIF
jgi:hypothetical protein